MHVKYGLTTGLGTQVSLTGEEVSIPGLQMWSILEKLRCKNITL